MAEQTRAHPSARHDGDLVGAVISVAGEIELAAVLERFVTAAAELTGAPYGALTVVDDRGVSTAFVSTGVPGTVADVLRTAPLALGVLGEAPETGALRLRDAREHPAFRGIPPDDPSTVPLLGTSVRVGGRVFGHLYLSEQERRLHRGGRARRRVARRGGRGGRRQRAPATPTRCGASTGSRPVRTSRRPCWRASTTTVRSNASSRPPGTPTRRTPPRSRCPGSAASWSSRSRSAATATSCWARPCRWDRARGGWSRRAPG